MAGAAAAVSGASGLRAWLALRQPDWMTELRLKRLTFGLGIAAILAAGCARLWRRVDA
jgi:hypothetical protein